MGIIEEFTDFLNGLEDKGDKFESKDKKYFWSVDLPCGDINKELDTTYGLLGIRADGDFWLVARFPIKFNAIPLKTLGELLWPDYDLEICPNVTEGEV